MNTNESISWSTLLAGWIQFAQSAVALPDTELGNRWKDSVSATIGLHAITMALGEIERVDMDERPLAMDKSEIGIKSHIAEINQIWKGEPLPESIDELIQDAKDAWEAALHEGVVWLVKSERFVSFHPGDLAEALLDAGFIGEVLVSSPGVEMFKGSPIVTARKNDGGQPEDDVIKLIESYLGSCEGDVESAQVIRPVCQVYRQYDFLNGGAAKDIVGPMTGELIAGQPILIPVVSGGAICPVPLPPKRGKPMDPVELVWIEHETSKDDPN